MQIAELRRKKNTESLEIPSRLILSFGRLLIGLTRLLLHPLPFRQTLASERDDFFRLFSFSPAAY